MANMYVNVLYYFCVKASSHKPSRGESNLDQDITTTPHYSLRFDFFIILASDLGICAEIVIWLAWPQGESAQLTFSSSGKTIKPGVNAREYFHGERGGELVCLRGQNIARAAISPTECL